MEEMILPTPALTKKLQQSRLTGRPLYLYGGIGCGKTTSIRNYFRNKRYSSCPLAGISPEKAYEPLCRGHHGAAGCH